MTREEEINKEAHRVSCNGDEFSSFILGAEWADETMIDKACEWLRNYNTGVRGEEFINEFREAMKGE
jgi:hypothetical protein